MPAMILEIDVISDVVCPWCYIGKRRLERALQTLDGRYEYRVTWCPFELNPGMPPEGMDHRQYLEAKFGTLAAVRQLEARVAAAGSEEGLVFAFDKIRRTPNTFDAHRLIWLAQREGVQDAVVEGLFRGYFTEGADLSRRETLIGIAGGAGLSTDRVERLLNGGDGIAAVRKEEAEARKAGINAVPHFLIHRRYALSGAQDPRRLASAFEMAIGQATVK
jgi:predicted DsbA family dithiol-disulfide isomerase